VTTLTKRMSEDSPIFLMELISACVLFELADIDRSSVWKIIRDLTARPKFDVLVGAINLLREGLGYASRCRLVTILDADKEGSWRSERFLLIQTIGRAGS